MSVKKITALIIILVLPFACGLSSAENFHPTDQALIQNFMQNEGDFNRLGEMAGEDSKLVRIAHDFTWTKESAAFPRPDNESGITNERWHEYKKAFAKLKLANGILNYQPEKAYFSSSSKGLLTGGSSKGYAWLKDEPARLADSLDSYIFETSTSESKIAYRKVKDNWYLYYESTN